MINKTIIIAEVGVNHNGNFKTALKYIDECKKIDADFVKFQLFKAEEVVTKKAELAEYQKLEFPNYSSQLEMIKHYELSENQFKDLHDYAKQIGIGFLTSVFDLDSARFVNNLEMPYCKIASGEITNFPLIEILCQKHNNFIISTGMATLKEIRNVINFVSSKGDKNIFLLHCISEYPSPVNEMNLKAIKTLEKEFNLPVGLSDHSMGTHISTAAVALGAVIIEKHITFNKNDKGPDHKASLDIKEFSTLISNIRDIELALGDGSIGVSSSEEKNRLLVRKSLVAKSDIEIGQVFSHDNLTTKRPGNGLSAIFWDTVIGSKSKNRYKKDDLIALEENSDN
jgi:N,N'-diacetyllegionaminate synthase